MGVVLVAWLSMTFVFKSQSSFQIEVHMCIVRDVDETCTYAAAVYRWHSRGQQAASTTVRSFVCFDCPREHASCIDNCPLLATLWMLHGKTQDVEG